MSELMDKAIQVKADKIKKENEDAAKQLELDNRREADRIKNIENKRKAEALGKENIKEFVQLMLDNNVSPIELYSITGEKRKSLFKSEKINTYEMYGRGWIIRYPPPYVNNSKIWYGYPGLMAFSDMTLCEWGAEEAEYNDNRAAAKLVFIRDASLSELGFDSSPQFIAEAIIAAGIV